MMRLHPLVRPMGYESEHSNNNMDEPLLRENPYRFVLFPIQHNDVSISAVGTCFIVLFILSFHFLTILIALVIVDMADVQASSGLLLDR